MTHTVALIAARMGSSRLPGKALKDAGGLPMLELLVRRVQRSKYIDEIVIATTDLEEDGALESFAEEQGIGCFRGSSDDVLGRIAGAARRFEADRVLQLLGDNPLLHHTLVDAVVEHFLSGDWDYAVNLTNEFPAASPEMRRFSIGIRAEAMPMETLLRCEQEAKADHHREHATSYIARNPDRFRLGYLEADGPWRFLNHPEWTFAVNHAENLELIRRIVSESGRDPADLELKEVVSALARDRTLMDLMGEPAG